MRLSPASGMLLCGAALVAAGCSEPIAAAETHEAAVDAARTADGPIDLGTLGGGSSGASDINDAGVVVGSADVNGVVHAFRWTAERGMRDLGTLAGGYTVALRINRDGYILGLSNDAAGDPHIVIWTPPAATILDLGRPPGAEIFEVKGFNDRNEVIGDVFGMDASSRVWRWSRRTGYVELAPYRQHWETYVDALANDGSYAGTLCCVGAPYYAWYLVTPTGGFQPLGAPAGMNGAVTGMNDRHQVIGWDNGSMGEPTPYPDYWRAAFVWTPGTGYTYLGTLGGWDGSPTDINNRGEIVGSTTTIPQDDTAPFTGFYYSPRLGMLRLPGFEGGLTGAAAINLQGRIAGSARMPNGAWHAVVWDRPLRGAPITAMPAFRLGVASGRIAGCLENRANAGAPLAVGACIVTGEARMHPLRR